jgi:type IV pilus modification protein PilV
MNSMILGSSNRGQEGFTLIEVLIAVVILCVGLLAVGTMQISAIRGNFMGSNTSIALTLASEKMEDLLNRNYTDAALANGAHTEQVSDSGVVGAGGFYQRNWNIADTVTGASNWPTMKQMTVTVNWQGNRHSVNIQSMRRP